VELTEQDIKQLLQDSLTLAQAEPDKDKRVATLLRDTTA